MHRPTRSAARVPARRRCSRFGCSALLFHQCTGDPYVCHGCFNLERRIGLLKTCHRCSQIGLGAVEHRQTRLLELKAQVAGTRGYHLALLLHPPVSAVCVGLDPTCLLGVHCADLRWVVR
jgi:hypothetical protein